MTSLRLMRHALDLCEGMDVTPAAMHPAGSLGRVYVTLWPADYVRAVDGRPSLTRTDDGLRARREVSGIVFEAIGCIEQWDRATPKAASSLAMSRAQGAQSGSAVRPTVDPFGDN